ncbi:MAG: Ppx/GppA family phosphatase [Gammaproteobacteria bacterium]|nr:Ppx/GppA family phosphatase [Gammaproteobacteria bacterium]
MSLLHFSHTCVSSPLNDVIGANNDKDNHLTRALYKPWLAAALDLGSNSFHVTIVDTRAKPYRVVCRYGEKVQLGAGLNDANELSETAIVRALACIKGMAQRMAGVAPKNRHVIATNTLRVAHNRQRFIEQAELVLQTPIKVVSGEDEADLIFRGVLEELQTKTLQEQAKLVIDIGGGSTEIVCGQWQPQLLNSYAMGCVAYSQRFFTSRKITEVALNAAIAEAQATVQVHLNDYLACSWQVCIGSSGTIKALAALSERREQGLGILDRASMQAVRQKILQFTTLDEVHLQHLRPDRGEVLPAGYAIMQGVMQAFDLDKVYFSTGALREGAISRYIN